MGEEAEDGEAVIDGDQHDAVAGDAFAIEVGAGGGAAVVAAAVHPNHHRFAGAGGPVGRPDVEKEAILAAVFLHASAGILGARRAEGGGLAGAGPGSGRLWGPPAEIANRRLRIRYAFEDS